MRDPRPLVEEDATDFERRLLASARSEEPPPALVRQMERALGIGAGAVLASSAASSASASVPAAGQVGQVSVASAAGTPVYGGAAAVKLGAALKVAGVVGLVLAGAVGVNLLFPRGAGQTRQLAVREAPVVSATPAATPTPTPTPTPTELAPASAVAPPGVNDGRAQRPGAGAALAARGAALRGEIALIDGARSALAGGAPGRALRILDRHDARYARGALVPEAQALRIEALARSGQRERAKALARAFLADNPRSPLAERVTRAANDEESP